MRTDPVARAYSEALLEIARERGRVDDVGANLPFTSRSASPATVGASNRIRRGTSTSNALRTRETTRVASSEWPPSAKKLSSTPTRSTPNTSDHSSTNSSSWASRGATKRFRPEDYIRQRKPRNKKGQKRQKRQKGQRK